MSTFTIQNNDFNLDGTPFQIISGALHYFRIPRAYWEDRLSKARWMGLNTIETYVAWNLHEPRPNKFNFSDNLDLAAFIRLAAQHELKVILRPGPYICSEWEFGGLPAWLLKDPHMQVRCAYPPYLAAVENFFNHLLPQVEPLQITRGGPIIMVQIENEYGSYGDDKTYLQHLHDLIRKNNLDVLLFTSDGDAGTHLLAGTLENIHATVNFAFRPRHAFGNLHKFQPQGPHMCAEFWNGWFDHWGERHHRRPGLETALTFEAMLKAGNSVNLYMWHGGTNFGFMNGANIEGRTYQSDVTSYDYDAPLSEAGDITPKYKALREVIGRYAPLPDSPPPPPASKLNLGPVTLTNSLSLWDALSAQSQPVHSPTPLAMEDLDQDYGFILYRTQLRGPQSGKLSILDLHDRAQVFLNQKPIGLLDRNHPEKTIPLHVPKSGAQLDILVENMGRVNFGPHLMDRKGILGGVLINQQFIFAWDIYTLPLNDLSSLVFSPAKGKPTAPTFYQGTFHTDKPLDTFLALPGWTKGVAWINGFNLGRYWKIGPQQTLYVPAPILKVGQNEIILFELHGTLKPQIEFRDKPKL